LEVSPPPGPGEEESDVSNKQQRIAEALERRDAEIKRQALRIAALEGALREAVESMKHCGYHRRARALATAALGEEEG
jgi:hypothetical protein